MLIWQQKKKYGHLHCISQPVKIGQEKQRNPCAPVRDVFQ